MSQYVPLNKVLAMMRIVKDKEDNPLLKREDKNTDIDKYILKCDLWLENHSKDCYYLKDEY